MYRHILIATDGSELSALAVGAGLRLAHALRARASAVTVTPPFHTFSLAPAQAEYSVEGYREHVREEAARTLEKVRAEAEAIGLSCETLHTTHDHPWEAIIETARTRQCDLITMASHGRRGVGAVLLGSETLRVLTHSTIPVLVHR
jgi:nucleotide-binding universal stress UspA family protein